MKPPVTTVASLPGQLALSRERYLCYFGPTKYGPAFLLRLAIRMPLLLAFLTGMGGRALHWMRMQSQFRSGCLCPSVVLRRRDNMVATSTNLSFNGGCVMVIKIAQVRLDLMPPTMVEDGARFASVSVYHPTPEGNAGGHWGTFSPIAVDTMAVDPIACETALYSLPDTEWTVLKIGLSQLPEGCPAGLYRVEIPEVLLRHMM